MTVRPLEVLEVQPRILEDSMEKPVAQVSFPMYGDSRSATIRVAIDRMASTLTLQREAAALENLDNFTGGKLWKARGHTSTRTVEVLTSS